jgi:hypothetical protein
MFHIHPPLVIGFVTGKVTGNFMFLFYHCYSFLSMEDFYFGILYEPHFSFLCKCYKIGNITGYSYIFGSFMVNCL